MFDELIRVAQQLDGMSVSAPVEEDADGYVDKECPGDDCKFGFKIHGEDWRDKVRDEEVFCPFCRHTAHARSWFTTEQVEQLQKVALSKVKGMLGDAMRRDAANWNGRQSRNSFLKISMQVSGVPREVVLPAAATDPMRLKISCELCACRYSVIGSAFFCPACGHNAAEHMFTQSLTTIRNTIGALGAIREGVNDKDVAENTVRLVIESGLQGTVTAFQRYAEALYSRAGAGTVPKARRNVFQNLTDGSELWAMRFGKAYSDHIGSADLTRLTRYFQQRHVLAHRDGLVDTDYVSRSGDAGYQPGQRLVIRESAVLDCVDLVETLGARLAGDVS